MTDGNRNDRGAPPSHIHVGPTPRRINWLAWLLLAAGLIAALVALSRCSRDRTVAAAPAPAATAMASAAVDTTPISAASSAGVSTAGAYIAGTGALPQTFAFEKLTFDTASAAVRPADQDEVNAVAATLKRYANARIRLGGYADARGASDANAALGKARADSVKAALVAAGIAADRIDTASGGESDPVDTNATAAGRAENRRTELVVLRR